MARCRVHRRLELRRGEDDQLSRSDARLSWTRLAVFGVAVALATFAVRGEVSPWVLTAPALAFGLLLQLHDRVVRARYSGAAINRFL
jgi:hypothetical protein